MKQIVLYLLLIHEKPSSLINYYMFMIPANPEFKVNNIKSHNFVTILVSMLSGLIHISHCE